MKGVMLGSGLILFGLALPGAGQTPKPETPPTLVIDRANWMGNRFDALKNQALRQIVLPGTHDAGMYAGNILGRTQDRNLYDQLRGGVRYFDLRPDKALKIHHGIIGGPPVQEVLTDVQRYMAEGHRELAILKFSHYGDGFSDVHYRELVRLLQNTLGDWLLPKTWTGRLADAPLGSVMGGGGKVLVVCDGKFPLQIPTRGIYVYRDWEASDPEAGDLTVYDQYSNTVDYERMAQDQLAKFASFDGKCKHNPHVPCDLFLLSWTLTPPTGVGIVSKIANRKLGEALAAVQGNGQARITNILYVDYFENSRATDVAIEMNERLRSSSSTRPPPAAPGGMP